MRELACLNNVMPQHKHLPARGVVREHVTESSPLRGNQRKWCSIAAQQDAGTSSPFSFDIGLYCKRDKLSCTGSKPHRQWGSGRGDLPPQLASHLARICGRRMTPDDGSDAAAAVVTLARKTCRLQA
ncbi:hypothetical protein CORC01_04395 [Colletotrichum orchidophilum]|uniref:Uncharacterized protein n=1 Tax=Colletotrichum orchidophilum TaxID=1209926 RepID=A0A1G4BFS6_9PEZI|nr:uncharacterized protein CORC01_04395 [Colletotrichum orchidophilum]OHF00206.1 hypothetical protein CORC01_04395 [Colletotrichum orchidophilum]